MRGAQRSERVAGLAALSAAYVISQFFRTELAVIAPELAADLALDSAELGLLSAVWFVAFAAAQLPIGLALDRFGPRRTVGLLMAAAVVGCALFARAGSLAEALAGQVLIGIGCAPVFMGVLVFIGRWFPADRFAFLSSLLLAIGSLGGLLGATPLAAASEALGWRGALLSVAGLTVVAAVLVLALVRDPPPLRSEGAESVRGLLAGLAAVLRIRALWLLLPLAFTATGAILSVRGLWAGPYLAEIHGLSPIPRGNVLVAVAVAMTVGIMGYAALERKLDRRKSLVLAGTAVSAVVLAIPAVWPDMPLGAAVLVLVLFGIAGMSYMIMMAHGRRFIPDAQIGRGMTVLNLVVFAGTAVFQLASGQIMQLATPALGRAAAYQVLFAVLSGCMALAAAVYALSRSR